jgi:hypothetical protein
MVLTFSSELATLTQFKRQAEHRQYEAIQTEHPQSVDVGIFHGHYPLKRSALHYRAQNMVTPELQSLLLLKNAESRSIFFLNECQLEGCNGINHPCPFLRFFGPASVVLADERRASFRNTY